MRPSHRLIGLALLTALGCGGDAEGTAPNTEVLDWSRSTYTTVEDVQLGDDVGDATSVSKTIVFSPKSQGMCDPSFADVRIQLDVDYGEVELHMGESTHLVPRTASATVLENDVWAIEGECEPQIRVPLEGSERGDIPRVLFAACQLTLHRGDDDARLITLEISGDQQLQISAAFDDVRVE